MTWWGSCQRGCCQEMSWPQLCLTQMEKKTIAGGQVASLMAEERRKIDETEEGLEKSDPLVDS